MRPTQLSLTAFVLFTIAQWRDCQAGHLGLRQSPLPSDDDVTRSVSKTSKGGLAATQGGRQSLERVQNLLDRANGKFLLGAPHTKNVKNNIATDDGKQEGGAGEGRSSEGNKGISEDKDELTDDITERTNRDDVTEAHYPDNYVTEAHYADNVTEAQNLDNVTEAYSPDGDVTEAYSPDGDVTEAYSPDDDVTEAYSSDDDVTEAYSPDDDVTEAYSTHNDVTEAYSPDDDVTEVYSPDDDVTEAYSPDDDVSETQNPDVATETYYTSDDVTEEGWTEHALTTEHTEGSDQFDDVTDELVLSEFSTASFDSPEVTTETYDVITGSYDVMDDVTESTYQYYDITESLDVTTLSAEVSLTENPTKERENVDKQDEGRDEGEEEEEKEQNMEEMTIMGKEVEIDMEDIIIKENENEGDEDTENKHTEAEEESEKETRAETETEEHVKERRRGKAKKWLPPRFQLIDNETDDLTKKKKKSHLDEALKKKMHDSHGFLVGRPDVEMEDEVEDLKILEAVVTSMAEWEFNQLQKKLNGKRRVKRDEEVVCYKDLGCFRDEGPFDYLDMLPSPPEEINTRFLLYTRERADREKLITYQNISSLLDSTFNVSRPTKMLIHGFGSSCYSVWIREMRVALLTMMDVNIICVNWQKGAEVPNYVRAASNTRLVGRQVAVLIETMNAYLNTTLDDFHLIGFSLGAHVSGHAGARLKNLSRISGLDPAGPLFESYSPSVRLDFTDAKMVDVIHTNADSLLMGGLGAFEPMGHVDFYPNGGRVQKGCANLFVGGVSDILWPTEGDGRYLCNHRRGYKYYLDSIAPICKFPSFVCRDFESFVRGDCFPCEKCGNMGYFADQAEGRGQLYLVTRDTEPFCANQYKVTVRHSGGPPADPVTTYGRIDITFIAPDGINETLQLTRSEDEAMEAGGKTMRILVPHPAISEVTGVQLRYTAYKGWIYSGFSRWAIDQIVLMDSFGKTLSFCNRGTTLVSEKVMQFSLLPGECPAREVLHGPPITTWPLEETRPDHGGDEKHKEIENEVRHVPGLRLAVAQRVEPRKNVTQNVSQGTFNHTRVVHGPIDAFPNVPLSPESGDGLLSITLEVPPNYQEIPHGLYTTSLSHQLQKPRQPQQPRLPPLLNPPSTLRLGGPPGRRVTLPPKASEDVAVSSEDPVSVIPAPDLANRPHNLTSFMHPPPPPQPSGVTGSPAEPSLVQTSNLNAMAAAEKQKNNQGKFQVFVTLPTISTQSLSTTGNPGQVSQTETIADVTTVSDSPQRVVFTTGGTLGSTFSTRASNPFLATSTEIDQLITGLSPSPATHTESPAGGSSVAGTEASHLSTTPGTLGSASKSPWLVPSTSGPILKSSTSTDKPEKNLENPQVIDVTQQFIKHRDGINGFQQEGFGFHPLDRYPSAFHTGPGLSEDIHGPVDYNSVIDGEIPVRERARALTLGPLPANVLSREQSAAEEKSDCQDPSSCLDSGSGVGRPGPSPNAQNRESVSYGATYSPPHSRPAWSNQPPIGDSPQRTFPSPADAPPRLPPPGHGGPLRMPPVRSPPLETIVGRGRALQPLLLPPRSDQGQPQQRHQTSPPQQLLPRQQFSGQQQQHRPPAQHQGHASQSHDQDNQPSRQHLVLVSAGNVTQIGPEISERSQHPVTAPPPYYVQILPPSFSQLPHLETFSIPREHRKSQQESRKRVGVSGRSNRGRSLSGIGVPPPGGRAAVFTPLLLQLQDDHRGRYIPLRPLPDPPVLT
ncbi:uncharacterized protein LOC125040101 isoform X2 [Penaeus chinensis]|uniref:uncharacterized protein LOC125040101 isoform X2 n=1 Tax=Penaeus chinensis TaxID=139456 RepID=UPI001FB7EE86|nr:uncharacterized protein LOC125040101 isoform X2 [Penaeus chinensis]